MSHDHQTPDPFALFRQFWQQATPPGVQPFLPPMTAQEVERKLAELHVVESWLTMSAGMLAMQINALEAQKAALDALQPKDNSHAKQE